MLSMGATMPRLSVYAGALSIVAAAAAVGPVRAATVPNFSGLWGRNAFNFEPLPGGPKPVQNMERLPDGTANRTLQAGDYRNPILTPGAARTVEELGKAARDGHPHDDPSNQCQTNPRPMLFRSSLGCNCCRPRITLRFFIIRTIRSAASGSTANTPNM